MFMDDGNYFPTLNSHIDRSNGEQPVPFEPDIKYTWINFSPPMLIT